MATADDAHLLRAYEPVLRFTEGEYFFPVSVRRYVERAALWGDGPSGDAVILQDTGSLDLDRLAERSGTTQGLTESLSGILDSHSKGLALIPVNDRPPLLKGASRLATVGLLARLIDAFNRMSLIFRGSVPGGSAARAYLLQRDHLAAEEPTYYGRVVRDGQWIICQYWFFYAFNNWRSAFGGVNEHEADWEQVTIYLDGTGSEELPPPRWVVFSAHDETGDDLRRRWDDPDLSLVDGRHPVVFAGAGSHSGAYVAGDYLITVPAPALGGVVSAMRRFGRLLAPWSASAAGPGIGIPYVDYARGDGRAIGPGADAWHPEVISEDTPWVRDYRGLWGHDTKDRLGGERGPAGPRYERDGSVRQSWADPVGWAGLAKVAPNPAVEADLLEQRAQAIRDRLAELGAQAEQGRAGLQIRAAGRAPGAPETRALVPDEEQLIDLRLQMTRLRDEYARITGPAAAPRHDGPHAHLQHRRLPLTPVKGVRARLLSAWSIISTPIILIALALFITPRAESGVAESAAFWLVVLLAVEGLARGKFMAVLVRILIIGGLFVLLRYALLDWRDIIAGIIALAAAALLVVNIKDAVKR